MDTIKLNGTEEAEAKRFASLAARQARVTVKVGAAQAGIPALMDIVAAIGFFGVLTYGGIQIIEGHKTVGDLMPFISPAFMPCGEGYGLPGQAWGACCSSTAFSGMKAMRRITNLSGWNSR